MSIIRSSISSYTNNGFRKLLKCLLELAALSWEALLRKKIEESHEDNNLSKLELEKKIAEQELELTKLRIAGGFTRDDIFAGA